MSKERRNLFKNVIACLLCLALVCFAVGNFAFKGKNVNGSECELSIEEIKVINGEIREKLELQWREKPFDTNKEMLHDSPMYHGYDMANVLAFRGYLESFEQMGTGHLRLERTKKRENE